MCHRADNKRKWEEGLVTVPYLWAFLGPVRKDNLASDNLTSALGIGETLMLLMHQWF